MIWKENELRMQLDECSQKVPRIACAEISDLGSGLGGRDCKNLERDKLKVSEYNKEEEEMYWFDQSLSLEHQLTKLNEQMALLHCKKRSQGYSAAFGQMISERYGPQAILNRSISSQKPPATHSSDHVSDEDTVLRLVFFYHIVEAEQIRLLVQQLQATRES